MKQSFLYIALCCQLLCAATTYTTADKKADWTFIVYIAADNDLRSFAARNIKQMATIGSNENVNIVVHLDIVITGNKKITRRYFIEKNKIIHLNEHDPETQRMNSGDPATLFSCCKWAIEDYPANKYAFVFWNHGSGIIDPYMVNNIKSIDLFSFNSANNKLQLDRSKEFLEIIEAIEQEQRGICWDDTTGNYINNQQMDDVLDKICTELLDGKKFDLIGFDACFMSMLEISNIIKNTDTLW